MFTDGSTDGVKQGDSGVGVFIEDSSYQHRVFESGGLCSLCKWIDSRNNSQEDLLSLFITPRCTRVEQLQRSRSYWRNQEDPISKESDTPLNNITGNEIINDFAKMGPIKNKTRQHPSRPHNKGKDQEAQLSAGLSNRSYYHYHIIGTENVQILIRSRIEDYAMQC